MFGEVPIPPFGLNLVNRNLYARINNDVPGFNKLIRDGTDCSQCDTHKATTDQQFYMTLRNKFRNKTQVDSFRQEHFTGKKVVGIHVRAGNGEDGDFSERNRGIRDPATWCEALAQRVRSAITKELGVPINLVTIFVATDTPTIVHTLQHSFGNVSVVSWEQARPQIGSGVLFGEQGNVHRQGEDCLDGWANTFIDMMLLSFADVLIASRPSSFTQSLPMSLLYATEKTFCEVNPEATEMQCFKDFSSWCCQGLTKFSLEGIKQKYDYLRMPAPGVLDKIDLENDEFRRKFKIAERPSEGCNPKPMDRKQVCLPYDWSSHIVRPYGRQPSVLRHNLHNKWSTKRHGRAH